MTSSTCSCMVFLVLLVFSLRMDEALGAQTEIRKLKETIKMKRNLKGSDYKNSKMGIIPSVSRHCPGPTKLKNMVTTNDYGDGSFTCIKCVLGQTVCLTCTYTRHCESSFNGSPPSCTYKELLCCAVPPPP